jgi:hypothetical protein
MNENKIKNKFDNYERVENACLGLLRAVVWECLDIFGGVYEDEVENVLKQYQNEAKERIIKSVMEDAKKFFDSYSSRYGVHCVGIDENGKEVENSAVHLSTNDISVAINTCITFSTNYKGRCKLMIYDYDEGKVIL